MALLHEKAKGNETLANHLAHCDPRAKYTTPDIQNELYHPVCMTFEMTLYILLCNVTLLCTFIFIADEATYCSTREEISLWVRYYDQEKITKYFLKILIAPCKTYA